MFFKLSEIWSGLFIPDPYPVFAKKWWQKKGGRIWPRGSKLVMVPTSVPDPVDPVLIGLVDRIRMRTILSKIQRNFFNAILYKNYLLFSTVPSTVFDIIF